MTHENLFFAADSVISESLADSIIFESLADSVSSQQSPTERLTSTMPSELDFRKSTVTTYEGIVLSLDDPSIVSTAMRLSYYVAMLDAAMDDPLDEAADQLELLALFNEQIALATAQFQSLVNNKL